MPHRPDDVVLHRDQGQGYDLVWGPIWCVAPWPTCQISSHAGLVLTTRVDPGPILGWLHARLAPCTRSGPSPALTPSTRSSAGPMCCIRIWPRPLPQPHPHTPELMLVSCTGSGPWTRSSLQIDPRLLWPAGPKGW